MQINFSSAYDNKTIQSSFSTNEVEALTCHTWNELYKDAQKNFPYYVAACVIVKNPAYESSKGLQTTHILSKILPFTDKSSQNYQSLFYDGVAFRKSLKTLNNQPLPLQDPVTRLEILKVDYLFFKCLSFTHPDESKNYSLPLYPCSQPKWKNHESLTRLANDSGLSDILFDGLNLFAIDLSKLEIALSQLTVGLKLMQSEETIKLGFRWIWTAAKNDFFIAQRMLAIYSLRIKQKNFVKNESEIRYWLERASENNDEVSIDFLAKLNSAEHNAQDSTSSDDEASASQSLDENEIYSGKSEFNINED